jgi:hypothetical protein
MKTHNTKIIKIIRKNQKEKKRNRNRHITLRGLTCPTAEVELLDQLYRTLSPIECKRFTKMHELVNWSKKSHM